MANDEKKISLTLEPSKTGISRPAFTVDPELANSGEVPSITKLLNRKTLEAKASEPAALKISPMQEAPAIATSVAPAASKPEIRVIGTLRDRRTSNRLELWDLGRMKQSTNLQEKLAHDLFDKRILHSCLFLSTAPKPPGEMTPHFVAQAAAGDRVHLSTWTGIRWITSQTPLIWNSMMRSRCFSLMGTSQGSLQQEEQIWRSAMGIPAQLVVTLIRIGTASQPQGVLVCVSQQPITDSKVEEALSGSARAA